jgi:hypothetical protein
LFLHHRINWLLGRFGFAKVQFTVFNFGYAKLLLVCRQSGHGNFDVISLSHRERGYLDEKQCKGGNFEDAAGFPH